MSRTEQNRQRMLNPPPSPAGILRFEPLYSLELSVAFLSAAPDWRCFPGSSALVLSGSIPLKAAPLLPAGEGAGASLPCFQGPRWLRLRGFCFSAALPIPKPEAHGALPGLVSQLSVE